MKVVDAAQHRAGGEAFPAVRLAHPPLTALSRTRSHHRVKR
ncbi:hypothetical protein [Micromonospora sp. HNM0581]|nr:hypothetical protein [Micromonospora sp. HNM0581]